MRKQILTTTAALGIAFCAVAQQGNFALDDSTLTNGLAVEAPGNWYIGTFGMEVWVLRATGVPEGINLSAAPGSGVLGYKAMQAAGFLKEATYTNQHTVWPGSFSLGPVWMPDAHSGGTVVVALAAWNNSAPSWNAMLASASQDTRAGIIVFDQPTVPRLLNPAVPADLAMDQDLVMTRTPEPSGLALIGVGAALLLLLRPVSTGRRTADFPARPNDNPTNGKGGAGGIH